jgi:hypothetical protein
MSLPLALLAAALHSLDSSASLVDEVTQWGNFVASLCAPFAFLPMIKFCSSPLLMRQVPVPSLLSSSPSSEPASVVGLSGALVPRPPPGRCEPLPRLELCSHERVSPSTRSLLITLRVIPLWLSPALGLPLSLLYLYACFLTVQSECWTLLSSLALLLPCCSSPRYTSLSWCGDSEDLLAKPSAATSSAPSTCCSCSEDEEGDAWQEETVPDDDVERPGERGRA